MKQRDVLYGYLRTLVICSLFLGILSGCGWIEPQNYTGFGEQDGGRQAVIWMLSDIQPPAPSEHVFFEQAIDEVRRNLGSIDIGLMAGDLLKSRADDSEFRWFLNTRSRSQVANWYEIAGNHDVRSAPTFHKYFPHPDHYGVRLGNLLILLLSDTSTDSASHISEQAFAWWQEMVASNQDKIIITVSHAQLRHSGLFSSIIPSRQIVDSARFEEVLKNYRVDLWISGHSHLRQGWAGTANCNKALGGTCFVNVSAIARTALAGNESRFLYLADGKDTAWIRSRNHRDEQFNPRLDLPLSLGHVFSWSQEPPQLILPPDSL